MKIGIPLVFSAKAPQVGFIADVLRKLEFDTYTSKITTFELWEKALFLGSNETCLPARIYIAHCHRLIDKHKIDVLVAPNIWTEVDGAAACSKYRDIGGMALRALSSTTDYLSGKFPHLIQPNLLSPHKKDLLPVITNIITKLNKIGKTHHKSLPNLSPSSIRRAFEQTKDFAIQDEILLENKPRIGIIGRRYLLDDPLLCMNIKSFFKSKGFQVVTPYDLPAQYFTKDGLPFGSYYDTHIQGEAFLKWGQDKLQGIIILSYFACHPDSFQADYFSQKANALGLRSWHFMCDSTADLGGFITRFETIATLIAQQNPAPPLVLKGANSRLLSEVINNPHRKSISPSSENNSFKVIREKTSPLTFITWPYMGEPLNLALKQLACDLGAQKIVRAPRPITAETLRIGSEDLAESCCPYALISGSLEETIRDAYRQNPRPIDAHILMLHGEGPCAFGWYSIAMKEKLPKKLVKISPSISINWLTTGIDHPAEFWHKLGLLCDLKTQRLLNSIKGPFSFLKPPIIKDAISIAKHAFSKLRYAEKIRGSYLLSRPFDGKTSEDAYSSALDELEKSQTLTQMRKSFQKWQSVFDKIIGTKKAPRIMIVGEIYVALTPYANRFAVDKIFGDCGLQVVEGITISHYLNRSLQPVINRFFENLAPVKFLKKRGLELFGQGLRDPYSAPFLNFEVGGDGVLSTGAARRSLQAGIQGIVQIYPLNCMPEIIAKPAICELAALYNVPYLGLSFNRETDTERLLTEILTFSRIVLGTKKVVI